MPTGVLQKAVFSCNLSYSKAKAGDVMKQIQDSAIKNSPVYSDEHLQICLLFMKYPFSYNFD